MSKIVGAVLAYLWLAFFMFYLSQFFDIIWFYVGFVNFPLNWIDINIFDVKDYVYYIYSLMLFWFIFKMFKSMFLKSS